MLLIVHVFLSWTVFSPTIPLRSYLDAITEGDYNQANSLVSPELTNESQVLLTSDVAGETKNRLQDVEVLRLSKVLFSHEYEALIGYTIDGMQNQHTLILKPEGRTWLFFSNWKVTTPLIDRYNISVPSLVQTINVNGMNVDLSEFDGIEVVPETGPTDDDVPETGPTDDDVPETEPTDDDVIYSKRTYYTFLAYPEMYTVSVGGTKYFTSAETNITAGYESTAINSEPTDELRSELRNQLEDHISECMASKHPNLSDGCRFAQGNFTSSAHYTNFTRKTVDSPEMETIDMSTGLFTTKIIQTQISYQYRGKGETHWSDSSVTVGGQITGTFSVEDEKVKITYTNSTG